MTLPAAAPGTIALDFDALYRAARDDVFGYVATMLHDRGAAEDVTALAFERAFRKRKSFNPGRGSQRAWLFGIARNAALDELRRQKRTAPLEVEPVAPEDDLDRALRRAAVRTARSEEHTSELQSRLHLVCRLLLEKKKKGVTRSAGRTAPAQQVL